VISEQQHGRRRSDDRHVTALARRYGDALRVGDGGRAEQVIEEGHLLGLSPAAVQSEVIAPAMERIGDLWEIGALSIADEHLATAISQRALVGLFAALHVARPRSRERIVLAAVEGQHHTLGLRMISDVLEGAGFDVLFLGADIPIASLSEFAARHQPAVTGLAFGIGSNVACLADSIYAIHEAAPQARIMLGGRARPPLFQGAGYPWVSNSLGVLSTVEHLLATPPQPVSLEVEMLRSSSVSPWRRSSSGDEDPVAARLAEAAQDAIDVARDHIRLAGTYREFAFRDPVTDLPNRRAFEERMAEPGPGALLMIDVDNFKQVNDTQGHAAGDQILRLIGQAIVHTIRPNDFAARIGGDEFAVTLPTETVDSAHEVAERVRTAVREIAEQTVSISIGMTPLTQDRRACQLAADTALYQAKAAGRDRTVAAAPGLDGN
jgi:diguanylate cyclase (GGDEF)-like protein